MSGTEGIISSAYTGDRSCASLGPVFSSGLWDKIHSHLTADVAYLESLQELRGYWEFAAVCQFLHLFHGGLKVDSFETEVSAPSWADSSSRGILMLLMIQELERQLMSSPTDSKLIELHIQLLKSLVGPLNARLIKYAQHILDFLSIGHPVIHRLLQYRNMADVFG